MYTPPPLPTEEVEMFAWMKGHIPAVVGWTIALVMTAFALGAWATSVEARVEANTTRLRENTQVVQSLRTAVHGLEKVATKLETIVDRME